MNLILLAIPLFFVLMGLEWLAGRLRGRRVFRGPDVFANLSIRRFSSRWAPLGARCVRRGLPWSGLPSPVGLPSEHQLTGELLDHQVFPVVHPV